MGSAYYGSKGNKVLKVQKALNTRGASLKEDGVWGDMTEQAFLNVAGGLTAGSGSAAVGDSGNVLSGLGALGSATGSGTLTASSRAASPELALGERKVQLVVTPLNTQLKPWEYTARTQDELAAQAQSLYGSAYDEQLESLTRAARDEQQRYQGQIEQLTPAYETQLAELDAAYGKQKQGVSDAALMRGMGRSSYVMDQLAGLSQSQASAQDTARGDRMSREAELTALISQLLGDTDQSSARVQRERADKITSSIEGMRQEDLGRAQEALVYNNQLTQARIDAQRESEKIAQQQAQFEAEQQRLYEEQERLKAEAAKKNKLDWYKAKHKPR